MTPHPTDRQTVTLTRAGARVIASLLVGKTDEDIAKVLGRAEFDVALGALAALGLEIQRGRVSQRGMALPVEPQSVTPSGVIAGAILTDQDVEDICRALNPYRVIERPSPGLAVIDGPIGRHLWSAIRKAHQLHTCANCGAETGWVYRPPEHFRVPGSPRLCIACVEQDR